MIEVINELSCAYQEGNNTEDIENFVVDNIHEMVTIPDFYYLPLNLMKKIICKCGVIETSDIQVIIKSGISFYGDDFMVLLKYIKCGNLEADIGIMDELNSIPIIKEANRIIRKLQEENSNMEGFEGQFERDWEWEINKLQNQIHTITLETKISNKLHVLKKYIKRRLTNKEECSLKATIKNNYGQFLTLLLDDPTLILATNDQKKCLIHFCSESGWVKGFKSIFNILYDVDLINLKDESGKTPLWFAAANGYSKMVGFLISKGADIEMENNNGESPLVAASVNGHLNCVQCLIDNGANIRSKSNDGITALTGACSNYHLDCARYLMSKGADIKENLNEDVVPLFRSNEDQSGECVQFLVSEGVDINQKDKNGNTLLMAACEKGNYNAVKKLISKGANIEEKNMQNYNSLIFAAHSGNLICMNYLIHNRAKIEEKDINGRTPLMHACVEGHLNCVKSLISNGANVDEKDNNGCTSLILAAGKGKLEVVKYLVEIGANFNEKDKYGYTALTIARFNQKTDVCDYLYKKGASGGSLFVSTLVALMGLNLAEKT